MSTDCKDSSEARQQILLRCAHDIHVGAGLLDVFFCGSDLNRRAEPALRPELRDALAVPQHERRLKQPGRLQIAARTSAP